MKACAAPPRSRMSSSYSGWRNRRHLTHPVNSLTAVRSTPTSGDRVRALARAVCASGQTSNRPQRSGQAKRRSTIQGQVRLDVGAAFGRGDRHVRLDGQAPGLPVERDDAAVEMVVDEVSVDRQLGDPPPAESRSPPRSCGVGPPEPQGFLSRRDHHVTGTPQHTLGSGRGGQRAQPLGLAVAKRPDLDIPRLRQHGTPVAGRRPGPGREVRDTGSLRRSDRDPVGELPVVEDLDTGVGCPRAPHGREPGGRTAQARAPVHCIQGQSEIRRDPVARRREDGTN